MVSYLNPSSAGWISRELIWSARSPSKYLLIWHGVTWARRYSTHYRHDKTILDIIIPYCNWINNIGNKSTAPLKDFWLWSHSSTIAVPDCVIGNCIITGFYGKRDDRVVTVCRRALFHHTKEGPTLWTPSVLPPPTQHPPSQHVPQLITFVAAFRLF